MLRAIAPHPGGEIFKGDFMYAAVRPYASAGIALVGAGVIAVSPLAPPMPHVQALQRAASSAGVELDAVVNPIEQWVQVLQAAGANLGAIGQEISDNPFPILDQVIANQVANAQQFGASLQTNVGLINSNLQVLQKSLPKIAAQLQAGNFTGALDTFNAGLTPIVLAVLQIPESAFVPISNMAQNFANVAATLPYDFMQVVLPFTYPVVSVMYAVAQTADDVAAGVAAGDPRAVVNALVNAPANLVGGLLNGAGNILGFMPGAGILTPFDPIFGDLDSGPIASLNNLREVIAEALGKKAPVATAAALAVTSATAALTTTPRPTASNTVTLTTTPSAAAGAPSASVSTNTALVKKVESSTGSADSTVPGTPAPSPSGSVVTKTHDSTKPGTAQKHDAHSPKAGKSGRSGR
jgi:hypothetical protein